MSDQEAEPLCLVAVHAHPDDEASKGAGTVARYSAEGVRCVLVTCTGGEAGEILNPAADTPEARADLAAVRQRELEDSVAILGFSRLVWLGYHDSGMPDTEVNARPDNFANAPFDEAVERLVRVIREERPQVILTYPDEQSRYPHPDHLRVHEISIPAFEAAGDPERYPDAGEPWQASKLYYMLTFTRARIMFLHGWALANGDESPFQRFVDMIPPDYVDATTTQIDVGHYLDKRRAALLAHRTQVAPDSFWFTVPEDVLQENYPWEEYILARSLVDPGVGDGELETDLFAGLRDPRAVSGSRR